MKAYKKFIVIMCIVASVAVVGCGDKSVNSDTKIQSDNIKGDSDEALNKLENEYVSYNISHGWRKSPIKVNDNTLSVIKTINEAVDIIVMPNQAGLEQISIEDYKVSVEAALESQAGAEIDKIEVQNREIGDIVYAEIKSVITKEMAQEMIDMGLVEQEAVDAVGGIDIYEKGLNMQEVAAYYIEGNNLIIIDGKCTAGGDIKEVRKEVNTIIDTIVVK